MKVERRLPGAAFRLFCRKRPAGAAKKTLAGTDGRRVRVPSRAGNHAREPRRRDTLARARAGAPPRNARKTGAPVPPFALPGKEARMTATDPRPAPAAKPAASRRRRERARGGTPAASTSDSWEDCGPYRRPGPRAGAHLWLSTPPQPVENRLSRRGLLRTPIRGCREDRSWAPARGPGRRWGWHRHRFRSTTAGRRVRNAPP